MRTLVLIALSLFALSLPAAEGEEVYRYTDANGVVHYTDKPPAKNSQPANLPKLQTYRSGQPPKTFDFSDSPKAGAPKFSVAFDSPSPEQTYREAGASVDVAVSVMPGLVGGYGLLYTVDGQPYNEAPSFSTSVSISGLERGTHVIGVSLVDAKRQPQAQASVNVHIKPPTVKRGG